MSCWKQRPGDPVKNSTGRNGGAGSEGKGGERGDVGGNGVWGWR